MRKNFIFLILFLISHLAMAYVPSITSQLKPLAWLPASQTLTIYVNPTNSLGISAGTVNTIIQSAFNEWDSVSSLNFSLVTTSTSNVFNKNELYFSDDAEIFGSGVIGIALVSYKDSTGEILEGDILINEQATLLNVKDDRLYLGNVITHEVGHFLGLGHEPTLESTMFYQAERGQYKISQMDKHSMSQLYPNSTSTGSISGKIVGGENLVGLFGIQVMALTTDGRLYASVISDADGSFHFKGLEASKVYYLYTKPLTFKSSLPTMFADARSNFCHNGDSFRGSFFQTCLNVDEGFPQSISVNTNQETAVGNITVRCSLDVPPSYLEAKDRAEVFQLPFDAAVMSTAYTGFFSQPDTDNEVEEKIAFTIPEAQDLNGIGDSIDLKINMRSQLFYSIYKADLSIYKNGNKVFGRTSTTSDLKVESDYSLNLDQDYSLDVAAGDSIELRIKPKKWFNYLNLEENTAPIKPVSRRTFKTSDFFPGFLISSFNYNELNSDERRLYSSSMSVKDPLNWYFLTVETVKRSTGERVRGRSFFNSDNSQCVDAFNAYQVQRPIDATKSITQKNKSGKIDDPMPISCGSIDTKGPGGGGGNGLFQIVFGFLLIIGLKSFFPHLKSKN